jgi:hypothetical protein
MAGIVDLRPEHDALEVVLDSELDTTQSVTLMLETLSRQRREGVWGLLCDFADVVHHGTVHEVIEMADLLPSQGLPPAWRQAILRPHEANTGMMIDLWCAAANNRGFRVAVFRDRSEALAWIGDGSA